MKSSKYEIKLVKVNAEDKIALFYMEGEFSPVHIQFDKVLLLEKQCENNIYCTVPGSALHIQL